MAKLYSVLLFFLFSIQISYGQKKSLQAIRINENISIDGKLNETIWNSAPVATDFVMLEPDNGKAIAPEKKTEIRILYDDNAIYIAALMYDDTPEKMLAEITERDDFGAAEHFGVFLNGFNDGQQDFRFFVSAAGVQMDCLATEAGEDFSWNAIWDSETSLTDFGWVAEMRIPYAALRFSNAEKQTWGLNFYRELRRDRQKYTWNPIDNKIGAFLPQAGLLEGIENIKTPTRLFFIPYSSYYYEYAENDSQNTFKAGMDIKYGINDSFTLDAILVPDFGQTKFDNVVLNLSPFEQKFNENRPFFTEGTDLFNKGNLLYSRRIGAFPSFSPELDENEYYEDHPNTVDLLNAVKFSGRTENGLGIGVLNAVTEKTRARVRNTDTGLSRNVTVEPLTNYNLIVLDQRFNQNSSVSLVNSNVMRDGSYRDANVSAVVWDVNTTANTYKFSGDFKYSYINEAEDYDGFKTAIDFQKISGKHRYDLFAKYISADYDINDLGIGFETNYYNFFANYNYRIINPTNIFNSFRFNVNASTEFQNTTGKLQLGYINFETSFNSKKNDYFNFGLQFNPFESFNFYQPRISGRYSYIPKSMNSWFTFSSNYNKSVAIDINPTISFYEEKNRVNYGIYVSPRFRFSDKLLLIPSFEYYNNNNDKDFADTVGADIIYAKRDRETINAELSGRYSLNNRMTFNLTGRYYWSYAQNRSFYTLLPDGHLQSTAYAGNPDINYNLWNFDLSYSWWFAPASQISILYRNNAETADRDIEKNVGNNLHNLFKSDLNTIFSISVRYFIDYNSLRP